MFYLQKCECNSETSSQLLSISLLMNFERSSGCTVHLLSSEIDECCNGWHELHFKHVSDRGFFFLPFQKRSWTENSTIFRINNVHFLFHNLSIFVKLMIFQVLSQKKVCEIILTNTVESNCTFVLTQMFRLCFLTNFSFVGGFCDFIVIRGLQHS